jgi:hypothetical protein
MRRPIVLAALAVGSVWTLLSLGLYSLIGFAGDVLAGLGADAGGVGAVLAWLVSVLQGLGLGLVVLVWLVGVLAIAGMARLMALAADPTARGAGGLRGGAFVWRAGTFRAGPRPDRPRPAEDVVTLEQRPDGTWGPADAPSAPGLDGPDARSR